MLKRIIHKGFKQPKEVAFFHKVLLFALVLFMTFGISAQFVCFMCNGTGRVLCVTCSGSGVLQQWQKGHDGRMYLVNVNCYACKGRRFLPCACVSSRRSPSFGGGHGDCKVCGCDKWAFDDGSCIYCGHSISVH